MTDQPRWPRGTPVGPGGKGPGGGRFRGYRITGFHGRSDTRRPGDLDMVFVSPDREGAEMYSDGGGLYDVEFDAANPLHIRDGAEFGRMWGASGAGQADGPFHGAPGQPSASRTFMEWVRAQGYDAMIIHPEAFETDDQAAWEAIAGTYGDPQSVILDPSRATFTPVGDWAQQIDSRLPAADWLADVTPGTLGDALRARHPDMDLSVSPSAGGHLVLGMIRTPRGLRGQGKARAAMADLVAAADRLGLQIGLTPEPPEGERTSVARLKQFYRSFGFVPNTGRSRDPRIWETMRREPQG